jgi:hypothetical protein
MKKTSLFIAALCIIAVSVSAQPQLKKGTLLTGVSSTMKLGGSEGSELLGLGFSTTSYKTGSDPAEAAYKYFNYNILPQAGYFFMDNLAAGLEIVISGYSEKDVEDNDKWNESTFGIGPFVRYYYPLEKLYPYAEAEILFGSYSDSWYEDKAGMMLFGLSVGAAIPLGEMVTFDVLAGYSRASYNYKEQLEMDAYKEICGGFGIKLGFCIYLQIPTGQ